jgi:NAD dependent epimerase/dehydratase family enzyme
MASVAETLEIEQSESELKVIAGESVRIFYLDGEKRERETPDGFKMEVRARWEGEAVVVEQKTSRGAKLSESYALSPDGASLVVTRRMESPRFKTPLIVRSVYEPAALDSK